MKINSGAILEFLVLKMLSKRTYSIEEMFDHLRESGFKTPLGSLYPLLTKFRRAKYVTAGYEDGDTSLSVKTYSLTSVGLKRLVDLKRDWKQLNNLITRI